MSWTSRAGRTVAVSATAFAATIALATSAVADVTPCAPTITAKPATDLVDGQVINVFLTGFPANHVVGITECGIPAGFPEVCDFGNGFNVTTNAYGVAKAKWIVRQNWTGTNPWTGEVLTDVDCKVTQCTVAAASPTQPTTGDVEPIYFR